MEETKKTILYVDDEAINLRVFQLMFQKHFNVVLMEGPLSALEYLKANTSVDYLISDYKMPEMNGFDLIKNLREANFNKPCFILSGFNITDEMQAALDNNIIEGYFTKPIDKALLLKSLQTS